MNPPSPLVLPPALSLDGRVALVSGAGAPDGIGFATARLLTALGANVAVTATSDRIQERAAELGALGVVADLTDPDQVQRLVARVTVELGAPDVLVNNAGMTSVSRSGDAESGGLDSLDLASFHAALARNLDTAYLLTRAALPGMVARRWGRVVMVASLTGPVMAMRGEVGYAAAKAGLVGLTRALAVDHAADGVTVNAVAPGWVATGSQTAPEAHQGQHTPAGRSGTAEEVAHAVAMLAAPGASYLTGQCVVVDGGNSVAEERA